MEKIGLVENFMAQSAIDWRARFLLAESKEQRAVELTLGKSLVLLKEVAKSKDIPTILHVEYVALTLEIQNHANSPEETNSIKAALVQLGEAKSALEVVKNPEAYQQGAQTYSSRRMETGLPLDSFREFIKSHSTRLTNRMAAPLSVPEKNILRQRKENLRVAKEVYMELQREALGLPVPQKKRGLER